MTLINLPNQLISIGLRIYRTLLGIRGWILGEEMISRQLLVTDYRVYADKIPKLHSRPENLKISLSKKIREIM